MHSKLFIFIIVFVSVFIILNVDVFIRVEMGIIPVHLFFICLGMW